MATMRDVARRAGVSASTVSYALSRSRPITDATRERIEQAMAELGYTPNALAQGLKSRRSRIIALVVPTGHDSLNLSALEYILAAADHARELGYHLLLWTSEPNGVDGLRHLSRQGLVDGALVMEVRLDDERIGILRSAALPFVLIGRPRDCSGLDFVDTDFSQIGQAAIRHLAGLGHRRIALVVEAGGAGADATVDEPVLSAVARARSGLLAAAADAGVSVTERACAGSYSAGRDVIRAMIDADPQLTAAVVANERAVPGVLAGAGAQGRQVPQDFSVLGLAMMGGASRMTTPAVTTVSPRGAEMGSTAISMLIRKLNGEPGAGGQRLFEGELVVRESTAPVPILD